MSYKRVILTEKNNKSVQTGSDVQKQLNKFDTSYTSKKLNDLYNEFDSITFNNDVTTSTVVQSDVKTSQKTNFKVAVYLTTAIITTLLLAFLAIYNIFVINGLSDNIKLLQENVLVAESEFNVINDQLNLLTEEELMQLISTNLSGNYQNISANGVGDVALLEVSNTQNYAVSTNWFDKLCTFLSNLFGR